MKIILTPQKYYEKSYSHEHEHKILIEKPITYLFSKISKDCEIWLCRSYSSIFYIIPQHSLLNNGFHKTFLQKIMGNNESLGEYNKIE